MVIRKRLGEILVQKKLITEEQLAECLEEQKFTKDYLGSILLKKRLLKEDELMKALSEQFDMPIVSLKTLYIDWSVCLRFAAIVTTEQKVFPIRADESSLTVAISNPLDVIAVSKIEEQARPKKLKFVLVTHAELMEFIQECKKRAKGSIKNLLEKED
jgi:type IV pilus assembly protein PilB